MKILITASIFPPDIGGPATYAKEFARRAAEAGHEVTVITFADAKPDAVPGVRVIPIKRRKSVFLRDHAMLASILRNARSADVIYAQNPAAVGLPSALAGMLLRKPVVVKYVGDTAWEKAFRDGKTRKFLEDFLSLPDANKNILRIERFVFRRARRIITPSIFLKSVLAKHFRVSEGKVMAIPNAVDTEGVSPQAKKKNALVTVARLVPWKGVLELITIMPAVRKKTGAELWVVGDGPQRPELEAAARAAGGVKFFGSLPHRETLERIASAKAIVLNSLYEGMPHVLLEAMAVGTPIIAADICGNPEVVAGGKNGLLVKPKDNDGLLKAVLAILGDEKKAAAMAAEGKRMGRDYNWDALMKRTLTALSFKR